MYKISEELVVIQNNKILLKDIILFPSKESIKTRSPTPGKPNFEGLISFVKFCITFDKSFTTEISNGFELHTLKMFDVTPLV
jgi:hypothetical protein